MPWLAALGALVALGLLVLAWAIIVERNWFALRQYSVEVLPSGAQPLKVLHISDMHLAPWQQGKASWIADLAGLKPDLVVMTGDSMGHVDALPRVQETLRAFQGIPGVFVFGSNDYHAPQFKNPFTYFAGPSRVKSEPTKLDVEAQRKFLCQELGWLNLNNSAGSLTIHGQNFTFEGVDDPHHKLDDLELTRRHRSSFDDGIVIGVSHAPYRRVLDGFVEDNAAVIFTGHTHGGQVCTPWFRPIVTNCDVPRKNAKGYSRWHTQDSSSELFVSAGLGTSIYAPVRLFCRPEASLITLVPALSR